MSRTARVLVVDDNPGDVLLIREVISGDGDVAIEVASDTSEGARKFAAAAFDLVLVDINLPGGSGLDLVSNLRALEKEERTLIVIFTSSNMIEDVRAANAGGADMFVVKPFDVREYMRVLQKLMAELVRSRVA